MCIAIIKKSKNPKYAFFIGLNRDEKYSNEWENINNHWKDTPDIFGYKEKSTGGTWFAFNLNIIAILINKESQGYEHLKSRSQIVLLSLQNSDSINISMDNLCKIDMSEYKPFNLILLSREQVVWGTNLYNNEIRSELSFQIIKDELILLNRSLPNDMNETRLSSNFDKFKNAKEPYPQKKNWKEWEQLLIKECFANEPSQEVCLWLNSDDWGTLLSTIIAFSKDKKKYPFIHTVKERKLI